MVYLKSCPKCLGDLTMREDAYGSFISCIQCGFMRDIDSGAVLKASARAPTAPAAKAWAAEKEALPRAA